MTRRKGWAPGLAASHMLASEISSSPSALQVAVAELPCLYVRTSWGIAQSFHPSGSLLFFHLVGHLMYIPFLWQLERAMRPGFSNLVSSVSSTLEANKTSEFWIDAGDLCCAVIRLSRAPDYHPDSTSNFHLAVLDDDRASFIKL